LPYVRLVQETPGLLEPAAAPVLHGERFAGRPIYFSDVVVRADRPWRSLADLRGRSWAYNDPDSHSGYNVVRATLVRRGWTDGFFGRVAFSGYHQRSLRLVAAGEVDAAAIDCQVLAVEMRDHPELARQVRVIDTLGPSTIQPVVVAGRLPPALRADLRAALVDLPDDDEARAVLAQGLVERLTPVADADYDDIRAMLADAERAGFERVS
jgi:phosphonate transport system substrate-binding protein